MSRKKNKFYLASIKGKLTEDQKTNGGGDENSSDIEEESEEIRKRLEALLLSSAPDFDLLKKQRRESEVLAKATGIIAWGQEVIELTRLIVTLPFHPRKVLRAYKTRDIYLNPKTSKLKLMPSWPNFLLAFILFSTTASLQILIFNAMGKLSLLKNSSLVPSILFAEVVVIGIAVLGIFAGLLPAIRIRQLKPYVDRLNNTFH